jgi:hypothetical protein
MESLKIAVSQALREFNDEPFQKRPGSRSEAFCQEEKRHLRELPAFPYEIAQWHYGRKANLDSHIVFSKNRYSVPYQYVGKELDLKVTDTLVEIYCRNERVATHRRFPDYVSNNWSTHPEDMPDRFQKPDWDDTRIRRWAVSIGKSVAEVIERIFIGVKIKEQGYNSCLSVLRLSKTYSDGRLEAACEQALTKFRSPRYRHLKAILASNGDKLYLEEKTGNAADPVGYVRGSDYYGGRHND